MNDLAAAREARDQAIERVEKAANEEFKLVMYRCIVWVARQQHEFISDDLWNAMARHYPDVTTSEPRVMGSLLRKAVREDICEKTGRYRTGRRRAANATDQPIYRSLIVGKR